MKCYVLFATSSLLTGVLAYVIARLRWRTHYLRRRAHFEHAIATLSTHLINSRPPEAAARDTEFLEQDRQRLEADLQQARRMETIGALSSGIAHNFNNIVGAILGYAETAQAHVTTDGRVAASLNEIRRAGERARELIDQILTFGRRSNIRHARVSVDALVAEAKSLLDASLPTHVSVVIGATTSSAVVSGESTQLQQVILNVCNNAAQAMDERGCVRIESETREITQALLMNQGKLTPGSYVVISVSDPGRGMDEATLERLFEPFFTTRLEGNGLGLATVREIVLEHGGALDVRSAPGVGTRFEIWLPSLGNVKPVIEPEVQRLAVRGRGETVLVFDTDRRRLLGHEELLAALGYEPVGFTNMIEAVAAKVTEPDRFDAVLLCCHTHERDIVLERAKALHATAPRLPIMLASASTAELGASDLADVGITEIIHQPFASSEIARALARCLLRWETPRATVIELQNGDIRYGRKISLLRETIL
jgi:signal transduction histidine kinase/CheY-like chemotaxis protein